LTFADGVLVDSHTTDGSLPDNVLLATDASLDLYNFRSTVQVGDIIQLAVVGISESGKNSQVMLSTITVSADDLYKVPEALTFVSFLPLTPAAGDNLTVSLQTAAGVDGYIVLEWYRNLLLYNTTFTRVQAAGTYTVTLAGRAPTATWSLLTATSGRSRLTTSLRLRTSIPTLTAKKSRPRAAASSRRSLLAAENGSTA